MYLMRVSWETSLCNWYEFALNKDCTTTTTRATPAASVDNIVMEDDPGLKDDGVDETTGVDSDFFHRQYDSPIKQN